MLDQPAGHTWHVRWLPCEDFAVSPKEADKHVFLFRVEPRANHGSLAAVTGPKIDAFTCTSSAG
jgi:hypothetical protein